MYQAVYTGKLSRNVIFTLPVMPEYASSNANMFYLVCRNLEERTRLISYLTGKGIGAVFHYLSLHLTENYRSIETIIPDLPCSDKFSDRLVRLPMFYELKDEEVSFFFIN